LGPAASGTVRACLRHLCRSRCGEVSHGWVLQAVVRSGFLRYGLGPFRAQVSGKVSRAEVRFGLVEPGLVWIGKVRARFGHKNRVVSGVMWWGGIDRGLFGFGMGPFRAQIYGAASIGKGMVRKGRQRSGQPTLGRVSPGRVWARFGRNCNGEMSRAVVQCGKVKFWSGQACCGVVLLAWARFGSARRWHGMVW